MTSEAQTVFEQATQLPPLMRAELIERLYATFDLPSAGEVDQAWAAEAEARLDALTKGAEKTVAADVVFATVERRLNDAG